METVWIFLFLQFPNTIYLIPVALLTMEWHLHCAAHDIVSQWLKSCYCASLMITTKVNIMQSTKESINNNYFSGHINLMIWEHKITPLQPHLFLNSLGCTPRMWSHFMLSIPLPSTHCHQWRREARTQCSKQEWIPSCMEYPSLTEHGIILTDEGITSPHQVIRKSLWHCGVNILLPSEVLGTAIP